MWSFRKRKYDYVYVNFKNVLTIHWYFHASNFSSTMLYCVRVSRVSTRSYLSTTTSNLLTSFRLVDYQMFLVVSSFGMKSLGSNMRLVDILCGHPSFPSFSANFQNVFKNLYFFGSNLVQLAIVLDALLCTGVAFNLMHCLLCTLWYVVKGRQNC